ncbi:DNA-directed RNA polymerase, subunit F [Candidatus Nanobsidianus stetteri]|uniref:DNA-directed RNA polymerase subunit Rpo4 n=1 Tax=Nanobsidianus stetteri TaxID=1294122 RepID=R1E5L9_NANST|nr:DNA-directed RNA polymerase, subunit F [Candidatus Nanobsidianus stetteri]
MDVLNKKIITPANVKNILLKNKEKRNLLYVEERTLKFLNDTYKLDENQEKEILEELKDINLPDEVKIQILEMLPKNEEELRTVLYTNTLSKQDMEKILDAIKKYG